MSVSLIDGHIDRDESKKTDKEIIKTLEICILGDCEVCSCRCESSGDCRDALNKKSLALINRQQAEIKEQAKLIDRLQIENGFIKNKALAEGKTTATAIMAEYEQHRMTSEYINKLKAEIEGLQTLLYSFLDTRNGDLVRITNAKLEIIKKPIKAEAIKEFAERLKKHSYFDPKDQRKVVAEVIIDHYIKEMVGDDK